MSSEPPPPPQISPDGKFYWDGSKWVPMQGQAPAQPPPIVQQQRAQVPSGYEIKKILLVVFDDGQARCEHVSAGAPIVNSRGTITDPKERYGQRFLSLRLCIACVGEHNQQSKN